MNSIKTKIRRLIYKARHDVFIFENITIICFVVFCLLVINGSIVSMSRNWQLSERLTAERKNLELLTLEVESAELENEYYGSNEYQELLARRQLDKKLPGEAMVVLPKNSGAALNKHLRPPVESQVVELSNFEKWLKYLFPSY